VPSLDELVRSHTPLDEHDLNWLHRLVADWQILADFSFADLVLWVPDADDYGFWSVAQMRPTTGPTAYVDDLVGSYVPVGRRPVLDVAWREQRIVREGDPEWGDDVPVRVESIPVRRAGRMIAIVLRATNLLGVRNPSRLELTYLQTAADLASMVSRGWFPTAGERSDLADALRVGDGVVRIDLNAAVTYASPNAVSALRRLGLAGSLVGTSLATTTAGLLTGPRAPTEDSAAAVLAGQVATEAEVQSTTAALVVRSIPLRAESGPSGAVLLLRDVTELRRREEELMTREATIREIHHRVKNNLQTVAALLRLQARRMTEPAARAALQEAVQRVGAIAVVHEILSQGFEEVVDFDEVADRLFAVVVDVARTPAGAVADSRGMAADGERVHIVRRGSFGQVPADVATPLAVALTELAQNAVEHGLGGRAGTVSIEAHSDDDVLVVIVEDDGVGLPENFSLESLSTLGLSIVRTLICSELRGDLTLSTRAGGGTRVRVQVPVAGR
jgi:two-component sensor histidine kinase